MIRRMSEGFKSMAYSFIAITPTTKPNQTKPNQTQTRTRTKELNQAMILYKRWSLVI